MKTFRFAGLSPEESDLDLAREQNAAQSKRSFEFRAEFARLSGDDKPGVEAIRKFAFEDRKLDDFQSAELMRIFTAFRSQRSFDDMIRMFEESANQDFTGSQIVQEFYAVACNATGHYQKTIQVAESLLRQGCAHGEGYGSPRGGAGLKKKKLKGAQ